MIVNKKIKSTPIFLYPPPPNLFLKQVSLNRYDSSENSLYRNIVRKKKSFQLVLFKISLTLATCYFGTFLDAGDPPGCLHLLAYFLI